jgi:hypothetical protein
MMNRKTMLIALLALAVAAAGAFASGKKEDRTDGPGFYGPGPGGCPGCGYAQGRGGQGRGGPRAPWGPDQEGGLNFSQEKTTVTGPVYFQNRMHAELKAGGKDYELLVPRFYLYDLELKEGQQVSVEGYVAAGEEESYIWVTKAVIDGKEYDLERRGRMRGPGMMRGGPRGW